MREIEAASVYFRQHPEAGASVLASEAKQPAGVAAERKANLVTAQSPYLSGALQWPDPLPLGSGLPPVDSFEEQLLPESLRDLVIDTAERMQVPADLPGAVGVASLAGCVNRRARVQPKRNDGSWVVTPNLWAAFVAPSGFMKTPTLYTILEPLQAIEREWREQYIQHRGSFEARHEEFELRLDAWRTQCRKAYANANQPPLKPVECLKAPCLKRLIVNDATFESLHSVLSENPAGLLLVRDELVGWLATFDRQGREGERQFFLESWNGDKPFTMDRIGRGTVHVPACCISLVGGIQPGRLKSYLVDALKDGPANDGLMQRFQILVWPDTSGEWKNVDRPPNAKAQVKAARLYSKLANLPAENPPLLKFCAEAQELFDEWLAELERKVRGDNVHPALQCHLSKYRSLMPSLALLFELADFAAGDDECLPGTVLLDHARQAAAWCGYLESHARRVYSCVVTPAMSSALALAEKIKRAKVTGKVFTAREIYLKGWGGLDTRDLVRLAAEILVDAGWLRELPDEPNPLGGRPSLRWEINPKVRP